MDRSTTRCSTKRSALAVHSCKDILPQNRRAGLTIAACLPRADVQDALVGPHAWRDLPAGARVGSASMRQAQLLGAAAGRASH